MVCLPLSRIKPKHFATTAHGDTRTLFWTLFKLGRSKSIVGRFGWHCNTYLGRYAEAATVNRFSAAFKMTVLRTWVHEGMADTNVQVVRPESVV